MTKDDALKSAIEFFEQRDETAASYWEFNRTTREEIAIGLRELQSCGPKTPLPPHLRGLLIERMAKALCQHAYPARTLDEAVSPSRQLWMRMIPEAELALQAVDDFTKALDEVSSFATPMLSKEKPDGL